MTFDAYQFRVYVGPKLTYPDSPYHYDWNTLRGVNPGSLVRTLARTIAAAPGQPSIPLNSVSGYPTRGGVWLVSEYVNGSVYEYAEYASVVAGSTNELRTLLREESYPHIKGAIVSPLIEIVGDNGTITINETIDDSLSISSWSATLAGWRAPETLLRPGHLCLVQRRKWNPDGSGWGSGWSFLLLGVIQNPRVVDDARRASDWNFTIVPVLDYRKSTKIKGVRVGNFDVGPNSNAQSSTALTAAYKELHNADFDAADPGFGAANVLTDEKDKLWIGNRFLGGANPPLTPQGTQWPQNHAVSKFANNQYSEFIIDQLYMNLPAGSPKGARWLQITCYNSQLTNMRLVAQNGQEMITGRSVQDIPFGGKVIICENLARFENENPDHNAHDILTAEGRGGGVNIFDALNPAQGGLALFSVTTAIHASILLWGGQSYGAMQTTRQSLSWLRSWAGPTATAPLVGQTLRYQFNPAAPNKSADYWITDYIHTPGYDLPGNLGITSSASPPPWIQIELPGMGLELATDLAVGSKTIPIKDLSAPSTNGLPLTGTIQIGTEQIPYNAKAEGSVNATTTTKQAHVAGDKIYLVVGGVITDALPIKQIQLVTARSGIRPELIRLALSRLPGGARRPNEGDGYTNDYQHIEDFLFSANGGVYTVPLASRRIKTALLIVRSLNRSPNRPRLRQIIFQVDRNDYDQSYWTANPDASIFLQDVLARVGYSSASILISGGGFPDLESQMTATTSAYDILLDAAKQYLLRIKVGWDSRVTIEKSTFWPTVLHTPTVEWGRDTLQNIEIQKRGSLARVKQLEIEYSTPTETGTYLYPTTPNRDGTTTPAGPYRITDPGALDAIAINTYAMETASYYMSAEVAGSAPNIKPGDLHRITWDWEDQTQKSRLFVLLGIEHKITGGHWQTKIGQAIQVGRDNPN